MPYIKQSRRTELEHIVVDLAKAEVKADGDLNYILFKFCKYFIKPSYNNYKNFIGELHQCATEIERTILSEYEKRKEEENGEI